VSSWLKTYPNIVTEEVNMTGTIRKMGKMYPGMFMAPPEVLWTDKDSQEAVKQGWDMFQEDEIFQIEREDESNTFPDDIDALNFVIEQASKGDRLALKALFLDGRSTGVDVMIPDKLV